MVRLERIVFWLLGISIWIYLGFRAYYIPLIHDETVTYFLYFQSGNFLPPNAYWDANNHILNSALGALFNQVSFTSPFLVRIGSWLSFLPFLWFTYLMGKRLKSRLSRVLFFLPLLITPFFIEFFSLARGYGMAMAAFLGAIYFAQRVLSTSESKNWIGLIVCSVLATLGSLSVITVIFILFIWVVLVQVINASFSLKDLLWVGVFFTFQAPLIWFAFQLKEKGLLYYGGPDFIEFTLKPIARYYLFGKDSWWIVAGVMIISVAGALWGLRKELIPGVIRPSSIYLVLFGGSLLSMFFLNWFLNVNYPEDRAALFLFPLFVGLVANLEVKKLQYFLGLLLLWFPFNFVSTANVEYSRLWPNEHVPYRFWDKVDQLKDEYPKTMSAYFLRHGIWSYQSLGKDFSSSPQADDYPSSWAEVIMVDSTRKNQINLEKYQQMDFDSASGQTLYKRNKQFIEITFLDTLYAEIDVQKSNLYAGLLEFDASFLSGEAIAIYGQTQVETSSDLMHLNMICTLYSDSNEVIYYSGYDFGVVNEEWRSRKNWKWKMFLPPFPENSGTFKIYFYNKLGENHKMKDLNLRLAKLRKE